MKFSLYISHISSQSLEVYVTSDTLRLVVGFENSDIVCFNLQRYEPSGTDVYRLIKFLRRQKTYGGIDAYYCLAVSNVLASGFV